MSTKEERTQIITFPPTLYSTIPTHITPTRPVHIPTDTQNTLLPRSRTALMLPLPPPKKKKNIKTPRL